MYTIISAAAVRKGIAKKWETVDLSVWTMVNLYNSFRKIYVTLSRDSGLSNVYLDLDEIRDNTSNYTGTFQTLISSLNGQFLPTIDTLPLRPLVTATFSDVFKAGYTVTPVHPTYGTDVANSLRTSIRLTRNNVDYNYFRSKCLVSVNGFYHITDTDGVNGLTVIDAMKSLNISHQNQLGIYSFATVGSLTLIPITADMVYQERIYTEQDSYPVPYYQHAEIRINQNLVNKSVLLVLGGYLFVPDQNLFTRIGDNTFSIDFQNLSLLERYYESKNYLDLSMLPAAALDNPNSPISINDFISDANLLAYMTLSQSFFVVIDTPDIFVNRLAVKKSGIPGQYLAYQKPIYPLVTGLGRMPEYWAQLEADVYSLSVYDNYVKNLIYSTIDPNQVTVTNGSLLPSDPARTSMASFIEIGTGYTV